MSKLELWGVKRFAQSKWESWEKNPYVTPNLPLHFIIFSFKNSICTLCQIFKTILWPWTPKVTRPSVFSSIFQISKLQLPETELPKDIKVVSVRAEISPTWAEQSRDFSLRQMTFGHFFQSPVFLKETPITAAGMLWLLLTQADNSIHFLRWRFPK